MEDFGKFMEGVEDAVPVAHVHDRAPGREMVYEHIDPLAPPARTTAQPVIAPAPVEGMPMQHPPFVPTARIGPGPPHIAGIKVQAVVGGALQDIQYGPRTNPEEVKADLLRRDPNAKVKSEFFTKGGGGFKNDIKTAKVLNMNVQFANPNRQVINFTAVDGDQGISADAYKDAKDVAKAIVALGVLPEASLKTTQDAVDGNANNVVLIPKECSFGVQYHEYDGKTYFDGVTADLPKEADPNA